MNQLRNVLILDDEPRTREGIRKTLEKEWWKELKLYTAANSTEASTIMEELTIHLLITDIRMPGQTGLELLEQVQLRGHKPVVIVVSGYAEFAYAQHAIQLGVAQYLLKPLEKRKLLEAVKQALELERLKEHRETLEKVVDHKLLAVNRQLPANEAILKAKTYLEEHLASSPSLKEVAEYVHLNASYLSTLFKEQTGVTLSEYLMRIRLQRGKELLLLTSLPIQDIAERVGYQNSKPFIKLFKEQVGCSPTQYRKREQAEEGEITDPIANPNLDPS